PINSIKSKNQKAIIELLIAHGADVNAVPVGIITETALQLACQRGNEEVVDILLKNGAEINPEIGFRNALAKASGAGSLGIVKKLIDLGADIQHPDVLSAAAKKGNLGIVNYLIERGADLHGYNGLKALEATISEDH
ncbi:ankyrin, partial [Cucurbitaria berberidis CBS 394.84]